MNIKIIKQKIAKPQWQKIAEETFGDMVKGVVDVHQKIIALGGELHADAEEALLEEGSRQCDLWGFNIFINREKEDRIEYTSLINIRPRDGNRDREVKSQALRDSIKKIIDELVE